MTSIELENLANVGRLKREPPDAAEIAGLLKSGRVRLSDAKIATLSLEINDQLVSERLKVTELVLQSTIALVATGPS